MAEFPLELWENEVVEMKMASDYWEKFLIFMEQKRGVYWFTNQRIVFSGFSTVEIPYSEIVSFEKCNVGPLIRFVPCGIKVTMRDGKVHYLSVSKRAKILELIQSKTGCL